jgi:hypothetical protein
LDQKWSVPADVRRQLHQFTCSHPAPRVKKCSLHAPREEMLTRSVRTTLKPWDASAAESPRGQRLSRREASGILASQEQPRCRWARCDAESRVGLPNPNGRYVLLVFRVQRPKGARRYRVAKSQHAHPRRCVEQPLFAT